MLKNRRPPSVVFFYAQKRPKEADKNSVTPLDILTLIDTSIKLRYLAKQTKNDKTKNAKKAKNLKINRLKKIISRKKRLYLQNKLTP